MKENINKFDLKNCTLSIRITSNTREVFVENGHDEGPIWLARGDDEIKKLIEILSEDDFESNAKKILSFISEPKTLYQIKNHLKNHSSASLSTIKKMIKHGAVESYLDANNEYGKGHRPMTTWFVATGKPYKFRKPKKSS